MLPLALSAGACSLRPAWSGSRSPPRSSSRATAGFARRASTAAGSAPTAGSTTTSSTASSPASRRPRDRDPLELARRAAAALRERRSGGALEISTAEPEFEFDADGHVVAAHAVEQTEAHGLIEQLMILTNERVAELCERRGVPTLYRVHERPDPQRIALLFDQLASLDLPTPALPDPEKLTGEEAEGLAREASRLVAREAKRRGHGRAAYTSLVLRSLKPAFYSHQNIGHGAGKPRLQPLHLADPALSRPDRPPGAAVGARRGRDRARSQRGARGRLVVLGARARVDDDRARRG